LYEDEDFLFIGSREQYPFIAGPPGICTYKTGRRGYDFVPHLWPVPYYRYEVVLWRDSAAVLKGACPYLSLYLSPVNHSLCES
jgi:hypothetical protein